MKYVLPLLAFICLAGCAATQGPELSAMPAKFKTVTLEIIAADSLPANRDREYESAVISAIPAELESRLDGIGCELVADGDLHVRMKVTGVSPGSAAARYWFGGYGAGLAVFTFSAFAQTRDGSPLGQFDGGTPFRDGNAKALMASRDGSPRITAETIAKQITSFIQTGDAPSISSHPKASGNPNAR